MSKRQREREEAELERAYEAGEMSADEYAMSMREISLDYADMAREAAERAYDRELENW